MNYSHIYKSIIENRIINKPTNEYVEKHHIKPKCLGGSDDENNLVILTTREHFICHALLTKIFYDNDDIQSSFNIMKAKSKHQKRYFNSRLYRNIRNKYYEKNKKLKIKQLNDICDWIDNNGYIPKETIKNKHEKKLRLQLNKIIQSKNENNRCLFFNEYQTVVEERGYNNLLTIKTNEEKDYNKLKKICDWIKIHNRKPKYTKKGDTDDKMASLLSTLKRKYKNNEKFKQLLKNENLEYIFYNFEEKGLIKLNEIFDVLDVNKKLPKKLDYKLKHLIDAKNNKNKMKWYNSFNNIVIERGYSDLFNMGVK